MSVAKAMFFVSVAVGLLATTSALAQVGGGGGGGGGVPAGPMDPAVAQFTGWVELVRTGGLAVMCVICGWWALRKDSEAREAQLMLVTSAQNSTGQLVTLVSNLTAAVTRMESTLDEFKDAVHRLSRQ